MYSLLCIFGSQYSSKVDFISWVKLKWAKGDQSQTRGQGPLPPIGAATETTWDAYRFVLTL